MTIPAVRLLELNVNPGVNVFEYGAGASSLFFASRGAQVTSIEHNKLWYQLIRNNSYLEGFKNLSIFLKEPVKISSAMGIYSKKDENYLECDYSEYVRSITKFEDKFFEIIVIDGRVRIACLDVALSKLRKGGLLVFDNGDGEEYKKSLAKIQKYLILSEFTVSCFDLSFSQTNIYRIN